MTGRATGRPGTRGWLAGAAFLAMALTAAPGSAAAALQHMGPAGPTYSGTPTTEPVSAAEAERWREDLDSLAHGLLARHGDPFHAVDETTFRDAVRELRVSIPTLPRHAIIVEMMRLLALIGDGHTTVPALFDPAAGFHVLPLRLGWYRDGIWVEGADRSMDELVGGRVVAIGGVSVERAVERVRPLVARDNDIWIRVMAPLLLTRSEILHALDLSPEPMSAEITVETGAGGAARSVTRRVASLPDPLPLQPGSSRLIELTGDWVDARVEGEPAVWLRHPEAAYWWTDLPELGAVYVQYNQVNDAPRGPGVHEFFGRVMAHVDSAGVGTLILDVRNNSGGEGSLNTAVVRGIIGSRVNRPGGLFVIIGSRTFSAAQALVHDLERWTDAVFVGEPTGSSPRFWGDHESFRLPNSRLLASASPTWWQPGGPYDRREYLAPDVAAEPVFEDFRENRDRALEVIAGWESRVSLSDLLLPALLRGDEEAAARALRAWSEDPAHRYASATSELNRVAYGTAREQGWDRALPLFRLNVRVHPDYANGWDSLGEALFRLGRHGEGLEAYRRAYELDPHVGNAAEVLRAHGALGTGRG